MIKAVLLFYSQISSFNIPFSILAGLLSPNFFTGFFFSLLTAGLALSVYFFQQRYARQWVFYYNLGLSRVKLISFSFVINLLIASFCFLIFLL